MKLQKLIESKDALANLVKGSLPISIAWELTKFIKIANPEISSFEELRNKKIIEMGEEGDQKGRYHVKTENMAQYSNSIMELMDKDIDLTIPIIKISDLLNYKDINGKGIEISAKDLAILEWLIVE